MLSKRFPTHVETNALSLALEELRAANQNVLDLTLSNPTQCDLQYPEDAIPAALSNKSMLQYSPEARGSMEARQAIAQHHGQGLRGEDLLLTASTSEAYALLFKLLADPGDEVLVPSPSYPLFEHLARLEGLHAISVPAYFHERWHLDLGALKSAITGRTRAVIVVNPNNPTGQFLSIQEWQGLTKLCADHQLALIVDEVFSDYALEPEANALPSALQDHAPPCLTFVLSGLSKVAALPQVKLAWIIVRGPGAAEHLNHLEFIADQYLSVSSMAQVAAPTLLELAPQIQTQILGRLRANLKTLDERLCSHPRLSRLPVGGAWSVLLRRPAVESDESCALRLLQETAVLVHPGHFFDILQEGHLVLSLLTPETIFLKALNRALPLM
jgi:alanine-synthesizing transaminase